VVALTQHDGSTKFRAFFAAMQLNKVIVNAPESRMMPLTPLQLMNKCRHISVADIYLHELVNHSTYS
jgi:hypothetical protein